MKVAAAQAIAGVIPDDELHEDYIIPSVFNRQVAPGGGRAGGAGGRGGGAGPAGPARRGRGAARGVADPWDRVVAVEP